MNLAEASINILNQLRGVIEQLEEQDFTKTVPVLSDSTIGQHTRHTLEFFICLKKSLHTGVINYDKRDHDPIIESDKVLSLTLIDDLNKFLASCEDNVPLKLESDYDVNNESICAVASNLDRELVYNIEHAIHHMAIIKIGLKAVAPYVKIPDHFGIAISTIKFKRGLANS